MSDVTASNTPTSGVNTADNAPTRNVWSLANTNWSEAAKTTAWGFVPFVAAGFLVVLFTDLPFSSLLLQVGGLLAGGVSVSADMAWMGGNIGASVPPLTVYAVAAGLLWWRFRAFLAAHPATEFRQHLVAVVALSAAAAILAALFSGSSPLVIDGTSIPVSVSFAKAAVTIVVITVVAWLFAAAAHPTFDGSNDIADRAVTAVRRVLPAAVAAGTALAAVAVVTFVGAALLILANADVESDGLATIVGTLAALGAFAVNAAYAVLAIGTFGGASVGGYAEFIMLISNGQSESFTINPLFPEFHENAGDGAGWVWLIVLIGIAGLAVGGWSLRQAGWSPANSDHIKKYAIVWAVIAAIGAVIATLTVSLDVTGMGSGNASFSFTPVTPLAVVTIPVIAVAIWWAVDRVMTTTSGTRTAVPAAAASSAAAPSNSTQSPFPQTATQPEPGTPGLPLPPRPPINPDNGPTPQ